MEDFEREQLNQWHLTHEFNKIIQYVDLLREPTYEHLGRKASALNNVRRYYEAIELLERIRPEGERDSLWYYRYGYALMAIEEYAQAEEYLLKCVELDETDGDALYFLGEIYKEHLPNPDKEEWVTEKLTHATVYSEELLQSEFLRGQRFKKQYQFLVNTGEENIFSPEVRESLVATFEKMTYALENVVQSNEQVLQLTVALGHEIRKVLSEKSVLYSEEVISQLTDELAYILNWFGLDKRTFSLALHVFPYVLLVDEPDLSVQPDHFLFLLNSAWDNQHEAIVEFILTLPKEDFTYAYVEWLVQAYIHLQEFDKVIQWLDKYRDMERNANWYYWYGLSLAQLGKFQQAKIMLITSVDMDASHFEAWTALERLFLYGLHDLKNANWARQQREQHCQLDEEDSADPYLF